MKNFMRVWMQRLQSFVDRAWYYPAVGVLAGADLFILVVPTDAIMVSSVMLRPKRWIGAAFWIALGSSIGAVILAALVQSHPTTLIQSLFPGAFDSSTWKSMDWFFDEYGGRALFFIAVSPLVQFPAIAIAALSGMPLMKIFLVCLIGRGIKCALFCYGASHGSRLLFKLPMLQKEIKMLETPPTPAADRPA